MLHVKTTMWTEKKVKLEYWKWINWVSPKTYPCKHMTEE